MFTEMSVTYEAEGSCSSKKDWVQVETLRRSVTVASDEVFSS